MGADKDKDKPNPAFHQGNMRTICFI